MLRNTLPAQFVPNTKGILNEVLSLNAQELIPFPLAGRESLLLNEVLSLNAQEWFRQDVRRETIRPQ